MEQAIKFVSAHWDVIGAFLALGISEAMALNPKWKNSGILQFILSRLPKKT